MKVEQKNNGVVISYWSGTLSGTVRQSGIRSNI